MKIKIVHEIIDLHFLYESEYEDFFTSYKVEEGVPRFYINQATYAEDSDKGDLKITSRNYHLYVKKGEETQYQWYGEEGVYEGKIVYGKTNFSFSVKDPHDVKKALVLLQYIVTRILSESNDCILMNGSAFYLNGKGYLLTGSYLDERKELLDQFLSKSAVVINDVRNYLVKENGVVNIYGSPWSEDKTMNNNVIVPLTYIITIMKGKDTYFEKLEKRDAFLKLMSEIVTIQTDDIEKWNRVIDEIFNVDCYLLIGKNSKVFYSEIKKNLLS